MASVGISALGLLFLVTVAACAHALGASTAHLVAQGETKTSKLAAYTQGRGPRVLIELFVMSRCPDARRAEARFDEVLRMVRTIADIRTVYIADEENDGTVACKHGPAECDGDIQQLCAQRYGRPHGANKSDLGWSFLVCQNERFEEVGSEELAESCLQATGLPGRLAGRVRECWGGNEGRLALRESAAESHARGVAKSCTVYIGGEYRCTHDDARWYDCPGGSEVADFVRTVCERYEQLAGSWPADVCGPKEEPREAAPGELA